jgi:hypothetical protein
MTRFRPFVFLSLLLGFFAVSMADDPVAPPPTPVVMTAELTDGSRIIGAPIDLASLPLKVEFGKLEIPLRLIAQADFTANRAAFQIKLKNADSYTGTLELERIKIQTAYGEANVPVARIARITIREAAKP